MKLVIEEGERTCPRCDIPLEIHAFNHHDIDVCPQCEGMWVEPETFRALTTEMDVFRDQAVQPKFERPGLPRAEGYLKCACCQQLMSRQQYKNISGVMIDMCLYCGFWLDKNELKQIRSFIAAGGLNDSQDKRFEKYSSQTDRTIDQLDGRVSDLEFMDRVMNQFSPKWWLYKSTRK